MMTITTEDAIALSKLIKEIEMVLTSSAPTGLKIERLEIMFSSFNYLDLGVKLDDSVNKMKAQLLAFRNNVSEEGDR